MAYFLLFYFNVQITPQCMLNVRGNRTRRIPRETQPGKRYSNAGVRYLVDRWRQICTQEADRGQKLCGGHKTQNLT